MKYSVPIAMEAKDIKPGMMIFVHADFKKITKTKPSMYDGYEELCFEFGSVRVKHTDVCLVTVEVTNVKI